MRTLLFSIGYLTLITATFSAPFSTKEQNKSLKMIHGEIHECRMTSSETSEEICLGLKTGSVLHVQTLKVSSKTKTWVPQNQIVTK